MKIITMYLPQFHSIPENDKWWGKGYTEWTAVRNAEPVFEGHNQPRKPLNDNYYCLLDTDTLKWQSELMKQYGVYGQCFYHYYFKDGKKVLEKPAEILLEHKEIDMPFCFSWANETWARSWSAITSGNSWNYKIEEKKHDDDGILLLQEYGKEKEWIEHLNYLLPFFADERYIRIDNKPLFVIHKPDSIPVLSDMINCWEKELIKNGFDGIYVLGNNTANKAVNANLQMESNYSDLIMPSKRYSYDKTCKNIVANAYLSSDETFLCGTPGYDDTPRRGGNGEVLLDSTPAAFEKLMKCLLYLSEKKNKEYVFINAWNEWGEGMYLEPDETSGYAYLEALHTAILDYQKLDENQLMQDVNEGLAECNRLQKCKLEKVSFQQNTMLKILNQYESEEPSLIEKLKNKKTAVYGYGIVGKKLINLLESYDICVEYVIDKTVINAGDYAVYRMEDKLPYVDIVIITINGEVKQIQEVLNDKGIFSVKINELF